MLKRLSKLFRRHAPEAPRHISTFKKKEVEKFLKYNFRVTGKLVWSEPLRAERLNSLARETLKDKHIVAFGTITMREIPNTAFVAFYRDYYIKI